MSQLIRRGSCSIDISAHAALGIGDILTARERLASLLKQVPVGGLWKLRRIETLRPNDSVDKLFGCARRILLQSCRPQGTKAIPELRAQNVQQLSRLVFGYDDLVAIVLRTHASLNFSRRAERVARFSATTPRAWWRQSRRRDDARSRSGAGVEYGVVLADAPRTCAIGKGRDAGFRAAAHLEPAAIDVTPNPRASLYNERCTTLRSFAPAATQSPHRPPNVL